VDLSDKQISKLDKWVGTFQVADYEDQESMVECFLSNFESDWPQGIQKFDCYAVITVHAPFATLACSHIFLAYLPVLYGKAKQATENSTINTQRQMAKERYTPRLRTANTNDGEIIVSEAANDIERTWGKDTDFNRDTVLSVRDLSAKLGHS